MLKCRTSFGCQQSRCPKKQAPHLVCKWASYSFQCSSSQWHSGYSTSSTPFCQWICSSTTNGIPTTTSTGRRRLPSHANVWTTTVLAGAATAASSNIPTATPSAVQATSPEHAGPASSIFKAASTASWNGCPSTSLATTATPSAVGREAPFYASDVNATTSPTKCSSTSTSVMKLKVDPNTHRSKCNGHFSFNSPNFSLLLDLKIRIVWIVDCNLLPVSNLYQHLS